jgi:beta-aspartyl-dipeptidase (metallo-type)
MTRVLINSQDPCHLINLPGGKIKMDCILIKESEVFAPKPLGKKDILIIGDKIARIDNSISCKTLKAAAFNIKVINGKNCFAIPGFIDQHLHFNGAGGEGGPLYRTPPLQLSTLLEAGITTAVGLLGTDGSTRSLRELYMKSCSLELEGLTTKIFTGSYQIPSPVLTSDITTDLALIEKVIGLKIAYSDHRSSHSSIEKLKEVISQSRIGGIISGKSGVVMIHIGEGPSRLKPLLNVINDTDIPIQQLAPTHLNRSEQVLEESIEYAKQGGYIDLSAGVSKKYGFSTAVNPAEAVPILFQEGIPENIITMSSDGNGVMTIIDPVTGNKKPLMAPVGALLEEFVKIISSGIPLESAIRITSTNVADHLCLFSKGRIREGKDADIILFDENSLSIQSMVVKGEISIANGQLKKKGIFE